MNIDLLVENFKNTFNINTDTSEIKFRNVKVEPYYPQGANQRFGEKLCLVYNCTCTIYNVNLSVKILSFVYENHVEVLKLEIHIHNESLANEITSCRNFLQRKRNLNLAFEILTKCIKHFEMRRLICLIVLRRERAVTITSSESGKNMKFFSRDLKNTYLELNWTIAWNVDELEVGDFIEFYCKYDVLGKERGSSVRKLLKVLVLPTLNFHKKLKLWKMVIRKLYGCGAVEVTPASSVLEISDSDSESLIEVQENVVNLSDTIVIAE